MLFLDVLKDSFKYPLKNFKIILILGVICLLSDLSGHTLMLTTDEKIVFPLGIIILLIGIVGCGYLFQIGKRTLEGDPNPPLFDDWKAILFDGFKVLTVIIIYLAPVILTIIYFMQVYPFCFEPLFEGLSPLTVAGLLLGRFYWLGIPDLIMLSFDMLPATPIGFLCIGYLVMVFPLVFVSLVHMIKNDVNSKKHSHS